MESIETLLGIIGTVSGIVSILTLIYLLGHKLGKMEAKLDFFDPKEYGRLIGTVDTLSKTLERDIEKKFQEITMDILSKYGMISKNPIFNVKSLSTDVIKKIGKEVGIDIKNIDIAIVYPETAEKEEETPTLKKVKKISAIDELELPSYFSLSATVFYGGREIIISNRYRIDKKLTLEVISSQIETIRLKNEDEKNKASSEIMKDFLKGYGERANGLLNLTLKTLVGIVLIPVNLYEIFDSILFRKREVFLLEWFKRCYGNLITRVISLSLIYEIKYRNMPKKKILAFCSDLDNYIERRKEMGYGIIDQVKGFAQESSYENYLCSGNEIHPEGVEWLSCVVPAGDVITFALGPKKDLYIDDTVDSPEAVEIIENEIRKQDERGRPLGELRGRFPITWIVKSSELEYLRQNPNPDKTATAIASKIGMRHLKTGFLVEIKIPARFLKELHTPTIVDANFSEYFLPAKELDKWGRSLQVRTLEYGLSEAVHSSLHWEKFFSFQSLGEIDFPPSEPAVNTWESFYRKAVDELISDYPEYRTEKEEMFSSLNSGMNMAIYGTEGELKYLEGLSSEEFTEWVRGFLAEDGSYPLLLSNKGTYNSTVLLQYYFLSTDNHLKRKFERTVLKLVNSWRESIDSLDYLAELLSIAGRIRIDDTYSRLLVLAKNESLKGQRGLGVDLHCQILRVLFGFGMDKNREDLVFIINRDIEDPRYAPLCFRRSWELEFKRGIDNLSYLLKSYHEDKSIDAEGAMGRFFRKLGKNGFKKELLNILQKMRDPFYTDFCDLLETIGIEICPDSIEEKEVFVVYWKEKDEITFFHVEIPGELTETLKNAIESIYCWVSKKYREIDERDIIPELGARFLRRR